jgi:hypothetical protein
VNWIDPGLKAGNRYRTSLDAHPRCLVTAHAYAFVDRAQIRESWKESHQVDTIRALAMEAHDLLRTASREPRDILQVGATFSTVTDRNFMQGAMSSVRTRLAAAHRAAERISQRLTIRHERIDMDRDGVIGRDDVAYAWEVGLSEAIGSEQTGIVDAGIDARLQLERDACVADINDAAGHDRSASSSNP